MEIKIQVEYSEFCDWRRELEEIRVKEYQDEKIKLLSYKNMHKQQIFLETNEDRLISFILPKNHLVYIGSGTNTHFINIEELGIISAAQITYIKEEDIQIKSNRGGYVGVYTYK